MSQQQSQTMSDGELGFSILVFVFRCWAFTLEVFLRKGFGMRYIGLQAMGAFVLIPVYCLLVWEGYRCDTMWVFFMAYVGMLFVHRLARLSRFFRKNSEYVFSYYSGTPRLMRKAYRGSEAQFKRWDEPIVVLICSGVLVAYFPEPFSWYLLIGGICMFINSDLQWRMQQNQETNMRDAMISQQMMAERMRHWR